MRLRGEVVWNPTFYTDLSGQRFERWTVQKRIGTRDSGHVLYQCICDCGWIGAVQSSSLIAGQSKSCGCLRDEHPGRPKKTNKRDMKLRTAIRKANKIFITATCGSSLLDFQISKKEIAHVMGGFINLIDKNLDDEDAWSRDGGCYPYWLNNDLILSFT